MAYKKSIRQALFAVWPTTHLHESPVESHRCNCISSNVSRLNHHSHARCGGTKRRGDTARVGRDAYFALPGGMRGARWCRGARDRPDAWEPGHKDGRRNPEWKGPSHVRSTEKDPANMTGAARSTILRA